MTALDRTSYPLTGAARPAVAARAFDWAINALRAWKNRRAIYHLGAMSDHELADIGLARGDLHVAWRNRFDRDPTATLGRMAEARSAQSMREAAQRVARGTC